MANVAQRQHVVAHQGGVTDHGGTHRQQQPTRGHLAQVLNDVTERQATDLSEQYPARGDDERDRRHHTEPPCEERHCTKATVGFRSWQAVSRLR